MTLSYLFWKNCCGNLSQGLNYLHFFFLKWKRFEHFKPEHLSFQQSNASHSVPTKKSRLSNRWVKHGETNTFDDQQKVTEKSRYEPFKASSCHQWQNLSIQSVINITELRFKQAELILVFIVKKLLRKKTIKRLLTLILSITIATHTIEITSYTTCIIFPQKK